MTEEEYLPSEETSPVKRESVEGFVYPLHVLAGALSKRGRVAATLVALLDRPSQQNGCAVFASDLRVRVSGGSRSAESLCLLVDTDVRAVRLFARDSDGWREGYWEGEGEVNLPCVGVTLTLAEMYAGTRV